MMYSTIKTPSNVVIRVGRNKLGTTVIGLNPTGVNQAIYTAINEEAARALITALRTLFPERPTNTPEGVHNV